MVKVRTQWCDKAKAPVRAVCWGVGRGAFLGWQSHSRCGNEEEATRSGRCPKQATGVNEDETGQTVPHSGDWTNKKKGDKRQATKKAPEARRRKKGKKKEADKRQSKKVGPERGSARGGGVD